MKKQLATLEGYLADLVDTALVVHERLETSQNNPIETFAQTCGTRLEAMPPNVMATTFFTLFALGAPICWNQERVQNEVLAAAKLKPEAKLLLRQTRVSPLRVVSVRNQAKALAPVSGPSGGKEEIIDGVVPLKRGDDVNKHTATLGWTVGHGGKTLFLALTELKAETVAELLARQSWPPLISDEEYWEVESSFLFQSLFGGSPASPDEKAKNWRFHDGDWCYFHNFASFHEAVRVAALMVRFKLPTFRLTFSHVRLETVAWPRVEIALSPSGGPLAKTFTDKVSLVCDAINEARSGTHRLVEPDHIYCAFGLNAKCELPNASETLLIASPMALLILPEDSDVWSQVHPDEPIRCGLDLQLPEIDEAFTCLRNEKRFVATYAFFLGGTDRVDLDYLDFAEIQRGVKALFSPEFHRLPITAMDLSPRIYTALERALRKKPYVDGNEPTMGDLPDTEREMNDIQGIGPSAARRLKLALLNTMNTWRSSHAGAQFARPAIDTTVGEKVTEDDLGDAFDELAALFD